MSDTRDWVGCPNAATPRLSPAQMAVTDRSALLPTGFHGAPKGHRSNSHDSFDTPDPHNHALLYQETQEGPYGIRLSLH